MAKLIGIHRNTISLVFLAIFIFGGAVQGFTRVCDRPSLNPEGSCPDNKTCRDACMAEPDGRIFAGACQTTTSFSQTDFTECVNTRTSNNFGGQDPNSPDCNLIEGRRIIPCTEILKRIQENCRKNSRVNSGDRCTCSYIC
ncbi:hypothetical protein BVRB_9g217380 [Beta vulgaris subsp. vulgaris]|uniref:uncharacterized protein LOC104904347 n=1 Tax=Beta vulgaris subsp. vulgaris TaxID=3555 RepID=UPI00054004D4|nr:uncharacterized protein LOC104904347 [Beta vulgaris subsp. vulgaris]KMT00436.1 hypothetical protein BVRB_9g217380 [Beta vulgaris subsp. vulgaris]